MSPYERIAAEYAAHPRQQTFSYYYLWHCLHGFAFATPDFCIFGRAIHKGYCERNGVPLYVATGAEADCWYIHGFSGDMSKAWSILPYRLPYIAWERMREGKLCLTVVTLERIRAMTLHEKT
jgi:hypothetical protein